MVSVSSKRLRFLWECHLCRWLSNFNMHRNYPGGLLKYRLPSLTLQTEWFVRFGAVRGSYVFKEQSRWLSNDHLLSNTDLYHIGIISVVSTRLQLCLPRNKLFNKLVEFEWLPLTPALDCSWLFVLFSMILLETSDSNERRYPKLKGHFSQIFHVTHVEALRPRENGFSRPLSERWTHESWLLTSSSSPCPTTALSRWDSEVVPPWGWFCPLRDIWQWLRIFLDITIWDRGCGVYHLVHRGQGSC